MAEQFFIRRNGKVSGPHSMETVKAAAKSKKLTPDDLISTSKEGPWKKLKLPSNDDDGKVTRPEKQKPAINRKSAHKSSSAECDACGEKIAVSAVECPQCGAPRYDNVSSASEDEDSFDNDDTGSEAKPLPMPGRTARLRKRKKLEKSTKSSTDSYSADDEPVGISYRTKAMWGLWLSIGGFIIPILGFIGLLKSARAISDMGTTPNQDRKGIAIAGVIVGFLSTMLQVIALLFLRD